MVQVENNLFEVVGIVDHIVFRNEVNAYTVFILKVENEKITAVGTMPLVNVGEELRLIGKWKTHPTFGEQFSVESFDRRLPSTEDSILRYLTSGAIPGVGQVLAQRMVDIFKDKTLEVIEQDYEKLTIVKGITAKKAKSIAEEFKKIFGIKELMKFLEKFSISPQETIKIFKVFGAGALDVVKKDPYAICNEPMSVNFDKADLISMYLEHPKDDKCRIRAGITYVIEHNMNNGHTCLPVSKLIVAVASFLDTGQELISETLAEMKDDGSLTFDVINDEEFAFKNEIHMSEIYTAGRLFMIKKFPPRLISDIDTKIMSIEKQFGISYADLQRQAIRKALTEGVLVLTGGPGTGKSATSLVVK